MGTVIIVSGMKGRRRRIIVTLLLLLALSSSLAVFDREDIASPGVSAATSLPGDTLDPEVSLNLIGWGLCSTHAEIPIARLNLSGNMFPRVGVADTYDLRLIGQVELSFAEEVETFNVDLVGTNVRSLFFLKQKEIESEAPMVVEIEGLWLNPEEGREPYLFCQGRLAIPRPDRLTELHLFVVKSLGVEVPQRERGGYVKDIEFIISQGAKILDTAAKSIGVAPEVREPWGSALRKLAVIGRAVRGKIGHYVP